MVLSRMAGRVLVSAACAAAMVHWTTAASAGVAQGGGQAQGQAQGRAQGPGQGAAGQAAGQGQRGGGQGRGGQARDALAQPAIGTGTVSGVITSSGGTPVRRARVSLNGPELRGGRTTLTNEMGAFEFVALPAGRFTLTASKAGYVDVPYGAKRPGRPGTPIQLGDGQKLENANITLPKGSVLTGFVVDENGEPSPGTPVRAFRYVIRTGERTLQQAGQDQTDDRGQYRIFQLQPGDYVVSAVPRNMNLADVRQMLSAQLEPIMQQLQAAGLAGGRGGGAGGLGGGRGGGGRGGAGVDPLIGGRGQQLLERAGELQQLIAQQQPEQSVAYAPVYYPGTTTPSGAATVALGIGEERAGVDFQLQLVQTSRIQGVVINANGTATPQRVQISLMPAKSGMPSIPGLGNESTSAGVDGKFQFTGVAPGQYTVMARATIREVDPNDPNAAAAGRGGRGGRGGGQGQVSEVLWAAADVQVSGQDVTGLALNLAPGMTITGRVAFDGSTPPPTDLTRVRVALVPRGQQMADVGGIPPAQVDATGRFTMHGVVPGTYSIQANAAGGGGGQRGGGPGGVAFGGAGGRGGAATAGAAGPTGQWVVKSAVAAGRDALDFPLEIAPNQDISGITVTFTDQQQELSGSLQDAMGRPTADYTIIVFPTDNRYWVPQSRRIQSARPDTAGKFTVRGLPPGEYRLTAVTDVETGEWYDPAFLTQLQSASIPITLTPGEKKVQDLKVASGG
jgi:protocatechuate 3,4-dioxygenase beta subunit